MGIVIILYYNYIPIVRIQQKEAKQNKTPAAHAFVTTSSNL